MPTEPHMPKPVRFQVTTAMVERFARLTGDRSSLHMDVSFARRSRYREQVVHGFLPLLFLAALNFEQTLGGRFGFQRLAASFLKPVYAGDSLELTVTDFSRTDARTAEVEFTVTQTDSGAVVTNGTGVLARTDEKAPTLPGSHGADSATLLNTPLIEQHRTWDHIHKGDLAGFQFTPTAGCLQALAEILALGGGLPDGPASIPRCDASNLLAGSMLSTLVGMSQPGRMATFLNFDIAFCKPFELNLPIECQSTVVFKSPTTLTMSEQIVITSESGVPHAEGKAHVRVNPPPVAMMSLAELKQSALDLGLRGKTVLITGGSRGIGETTAKLFALHGANVAVNYLHSATEAARIVEEINQSGARAMTAPADVTNREQVKAMVKAVCERFGTIDILVNSAVRDFQPVPFLELTWKKMGQDLDVVLQGAFHCCQEVLPLMVRQHGGKIINLSTIAVEVPPPQQAKYVTAKSALVGLSRSLAVEFAKDNIQINLVAPSMVETDLTRHIGKIVTDRLRNETPMNRLATPVDVARAVVFLASSLSSFTTGQTVAVTGGGAPLF